jgi:hypothetical protein
MNLFSPSLSDATPGIWEANCASEIFAMVEGKMVRIGHFQGCAKDAKAVVDLMNLARGYKMNEINQLETL